MSTSLDAYMKEDGVTDADLAVIISRDRSLVNKLRRGVLRPTLDTASAIEAATHGAVPMQSWTDPAKQPSPQQEAA